MPSIDLDALRRWSQTLGDQIGDPQAFAAALRGQFESHSNRLLRRGPSLARRGALPSWNVPAAMLNEIEAAILPRAARQPEAALRLADHLWAIPSLEEKSLAARLLEAAARPEASHMRLARWVVETPTPLCTRLWHAMPRGPSATSRRIFSARRYSPGWAGAASPFAGSPGSRCANGWMRLPPRPLSSPSRS